MPRLKPQVVQAFRAMRDIGIPEEKTKPVLKKLLRLYDMNWELIEQENYRALADAIFDSDQSEVVEQKKKLDDAEAAEKKRVEQAEQRMKVIEDETQIQGEPEKPLKRQRGSHQDDQPSPSCISPNINSGGNILKRPKLEVNELPEYQPEIHSPAEITVTGSVLRTGQRPVFPLKEDMNNGKRAHLPKYEPLTDDPPRVEVPLPPLNIPDLGPGYTGEPPVNGFEANTHFTPDEAIDMAKGEESVVVSFVNEVNSECPPFFHYIPSNAVFQNAYVNFSLSCIAKENCCSTCFGNCLTSSTPCPCALITGGEFAYTNEGTIKEDLLDDCIQTNRDPQKCHVSYCKECPLEKPKNEGVLATCKGHIDRSFIKECWLKCRCNKKCGNRVVQCGIRYKLQVFMTPGGKGWGLRALEDLPKGAFVCEFVGEVLTCKELYNRVSLSSKKGKCAYSVILDAEWGEESELKEDEALCLDATSYGNVARFINHRCFDANLVEIPVEVENQDRHYYHLALFTTRKVKAREELTRDYGIDFDDNDDLLKSFDCQCGSQYCRNTKGLSASRKRKCAQN